MKLLNFENWCNGEVSKIGHHLENKVIKIDIKKNVSNKKCGPELIFSMKMR